MFERFTERARQVVVHSQEAAREFKHGYIGTEHVLLGILLEEHGLGARTLRSIGVTPDRVRGQIESSIGKGDEVIAGQIPFTARAKKVFELALREALSLGHNYIGTEHIVLALVRENSGVGARILLDIGVDSEKVRGAITRELSGAPKPKLEPTAPVLAIDLMKIGDRLQSEASRVAEYLKGEKLPYEVAQAVFEIDSAVAQWTEARRTMGVQRAA